MKTTYLKYILMLLLIKSSILLAQENPYSLHVSEELKLPSSDKLIKIVGHDSSGFYVLKKDYSQFVEYYNNDLELIKEGRLKVHKGLASREFEDLILFQDTLYLFFSEYKFKKILLYSQVIDKKTLEPIGKEKLIYSKQFIAGNYPEFIFKSSLLRNKLLVIGRTNIYIRKNIMLDMMVFSKGLVNDWSNTDNLQYNHQAPLDFKYVVDEKGNLHMLTKIFDVKWLSHFFEDLKSQYLILSYTKSGESMDKYIINFKNKYVREIDLIAGDQAAFICTGFYSYDFSVGVSGVFYQTINPANREIKPINFHRFEREYMDQVNPKNLSGDAIYGYKLKSMVKRANGDVVLVGEQEFEQSYDNRNNVIIVGLNSYGDVKWKNMITKKQTGEEHTSITVIAPHYENNIKILYNDNAANELAKGELKRKSFSYHDDSYLVIKEFDNFGNVKSDSILFRDKKEVAFLPDFTYDKLDGGAILFAKRYYKSKFLTMRLFESQ